MTLPAHSLDAIDPVSLDVPVSRQHRVAAVFFVTFAFAYADRQVLGLLYEPIRLAFDFTDTQANLLEGYAFALFYSLAAVLLGRLVDTANRRNLMVAAVLVWSAATICCGFAQTFKQLFAARVGVGVGEACLGPAILSMIGDYFPPTRRARVIGLTAAATLVGSSLARIGGGLLLDHFQRQGFVDLPLFGELAPWRAVFVLIGIPGVIVAALLLTVREPQRRGHEAVALSRGSSVRASTAFLEPSQDGRRLGWLLAHRGLLPRIYLAFGLFTSCNAAIMKYGPIHLIRHFALPPGSVNARVGVIMLLLGGSAAWAGGWCSDRLFKRWGAEARVLIAQAGLIGTLPLFVMPVIATAAAGLALLSILVFFATAGVGAGIALVHDLVPSNLRGRATAVYSLTINLVGSVGPLAAAMASDRLFGGPQHIMEGVDLVVAPLMLATFLMLLSLRKSPGIRYNSDPVR